MRIRPPLFNMNFTLPFKQAMQSSLFAPGLISRFHLRLHTPRTMSSFTKSGRNWTQDDLKAYNIKVAGRDEEEFFGGIANRIPASIKTGFLEHDVRNEGNKDSLLVCLCFADLEAGEKWSAVGDFAQDLLKGSGYGSQDRIIVRRHRIPLLVSGNNRSVRPDVCIIKMKGELLKYLMLLQEDRTMVDAEAQVIAQAIAAFQANNRIRSDSCLDPLHRMVFPCITMLGTYPKFYLVPVTMELSDRVSKGSRPSNFQPDRTIVLRHIPMVSVRESMVLPGDRKKIIQCFEAFKKYVNNIEKEV